jgi:hemolysin III
MYKGERFNGLSHLIGIVLALGGAVTLVVLAAGRSDPWQIVSFSVYGTTLVLLYTFSTLYHSLRGKAKSIFRKLDHCAIYLLIAGTYTPFALVTLRGGWGWLLFGSAWTLAFLGITQEFWLGKGNRMLSISIYILMGWMGMAAIDPLLKALTPAGFLWLVVGGLLYTVGIIFYALGKRFMYGHGIWHLFVLAGSASHFFTILFFVA